MLLFVWMLHTVNDFILFFFFINWQIIILNHIFACVRVTKPVFNKPPVAFSSHFNRRLLDLIITKIIYTSQNIYENTAFSVDVNEKENVFFSTVPLFCISKSVNITLHFRLTHKSTMRYQVNVTFPAKYIICLSILGSVQIPRGFRLHKGW